VLHTVSCASPDERTDSVPDTRYLSIGTPVSELDDGIPLIYQDRFEEFMSAVTDSRTGDLWMATYDVGVWRCDGQDLTQYPVRNGDQEVNFFSIYMDRDRGLWVGTLQQGVYRFDGDSFYRFNGLD